MYNLSDLNEIKFILKKHGFETSKALGQNFIIDEQICPRMAEQAGVGENDCVLEIGTGIGVLTAELCRRAKKVAAIEIDKRLPDILADTLADFDNFTLIEGDAMKLDLTQLIESVFGEGKRIKICANLPYYITSPIIMKLLESKLPVESITVMVQKEAGERICAEVGSKNAGAVTAAVNYYAEAEELFEVGRECFYPSPKVQSEVIKLTLRDNPPVKVPDEKQFFKVVRAAFSQRRKSASNSLSAALGIPKSQVIKMLEELGFEPSIRAEKFSMEDFEAITKEVNKWNNI